MYRIHCREDGRQNELCRTELLPSSSQIGSLCELKSEFKPTKFKFKFSFGPALAAARAGGSSVPVSGPGCG
jgi:hypothetical protein